jgi:hypothetical protein
MNQDPSTGNGAGNGAGNASESAESGYREKFPPTSGRIVGVTAVLLCAVVAAYAAFDGEEGFGAPVVWGALFAGILSYAALLRPRVRIESDSLVLRNMLDTNVVPLASVREVAVRQVLAVRADEKRYVSPAIGTSFMRTIRPKVGKTGMPELTYPDYVRERILNLADGARRRAGDSEPPPVTRIWAWPELAALAVTAVGLVVSILA